jgi:hypothetical protein
MIGRSLVLLQGLLLALAISPLQAQPGRDGKTIGLLHVPEILPANICADVQLGVYPLFAAPEGRRIGELRVVRGPLQPSPDRGSCLDGPDVQAVLGRASFAVPTQEHGYEEPSLVVTETARGWFRILTGGQPEFAWMRPTRRSLYRPLAALFADSLTYLRDDWDGRLYSSPYGSFRLVSRPDAADGNREISVKVNEVSVVDGVYWARITFIPEPCSNDENEMRAVGRGWVRVHQAEPSWRPMLWFHSRGC